MQTLLIVLLLKKMDIITDIADPLAIIEKGDVVIILATENQDFVNQNVVDQNADGDMDIDTIK